MEERRRGIQVRVGYQKTVVNGREWKWNEKKPDFEISQNMVRSSKNQTRKLRPKIKLELKKDVKMKMKWG